MDDERVSAGYITLSKAQHGCDPRNRVVRYENGDFKAPRRLPRGKPDNSREATRRRSQDGRRICENHTLIRYAEGAETRQTAKTTAACVLDA